MNLANSHIQKLSAYQPPLENRSDFKGSLLDFNERSCALPQEILKPLTKALEKEGLQIYPHYCEAIQQIAKYCGVDANQVLLCNGSDSGISILFRTFLQPRQCAIIPTPSFPIFMQSANTQNTDVLNIPYQRQDYPKRKFIYPIEEIIKAMQTHKIGLVVVCTPNNPTGTLVTLKDIERILKQGLKTQTLVFVDEAYSEFSQVTAKHFLATYPNLVISRTFSKAWGLAGLRIGYLLASQTHISEMVKVQSPYEVNRISAMAVKVALQNPDYMHEYVAEVMQKAKPFTEQFFRKSEIPYFESQANFILFETRDKQRTFQFLMSKGILVRPQHIEDMQVVRLSIGMLAEMEHFVQVYKEGNL